MKRINRLLLIIDGLGDRPIIELDNKTPLQAAHLPVLDKLAREGQCGAAYPIDRGIVASTVSGTLAILGFDPQKYSIPRGIIEAIGCGMEIMPGDIAFRGNWGTIDSKGIILDRRAGRIREGTKELSSSINGLKIGNVKALVCPATEHRISIVLRGDGLDDRLKGSDPGDNFYRGIKPLIPQSLDKFDERSCRTANILNHFELKVRKILANHPVNLNRKSKNLLPANIVLSREPGKIDFFKKFKKPYRSDFSGIFITGDDTILGISRMLDLDVCITKNMTANLDTNLNEKFIIANKFLETHEIVMIHIKGCDIAAHNKDPKNKKQFLEKIDSELGKFLEKHNSILRIGVTADHSTHSGEGIHVDDPVPVLINGFGIKADSVKKFDETQVPFGKFGIFKLHKFWKCFFDQQ